MATICNIPSKYQEIISKSTQISRGIPAIYQLKPNKKEMGPLTLLTVGERHDNQSNKTILLVGETGTGKSTLINALFNHMMGVTWDDQVWFDIAIEEQRSQCESQTSDVIVYQIFGFEGIDLPFSLSIIDTPGYGDTRGIERDAMIIERLLDLFWMRDGIREINAVGLVLKASECRLSDRLQYAFNSVMSLFGKDLEKNTVALLTYSDGTTPQNSLQALENAKIKCARNKKNQPHYFLFNNQQKEERTEENELPLEFVWKITDRGMKQLMTFMKKTPPQKLDKTVNVLNERIRLTACIENLQERIEYIKLKQKEFQQIKEVVSQKQNIEVVVDEPYKVKEYVQGGWRWFGAYSGAVCCLRCEETCHYSCPVAWSPSGCDRIKNNHCTVCSGRCSVDCHVKENWRYVNMSRKVTKIIPDLKKMREYSNLLEGVEADERKNMEEKKRLLDEAYEHVMSLKKLALSINAVSTFIPYDFLIEKMRERGDEAKAKELEEMKSQAEQENKSAAGNFGAKLMGMFK